MSTASLSALSEDGAEGDAGTRAGTVASGQRGCQGAGPCPLRCQRRGSIVSITASGARRAPQLIGGAWLVPVHGSFTPPLQPRSSRLRCVWSRHAAADRKARRQARRRPGRSRQRHRRQPRHQRHQEVDVRCRRARPCPTARFRLALRRAPPRRRLRPHPVLQRHHRARLHRRLNRRPRRIQPRHWQCLRRRRHAWRARTTSSRSRWAGASRAANT